MLRKSENIAITLILLAFVGASFAYSVVNPLHEATDELRHYRFVRYVATKHALPVQGAEGCSAQGHHPPLFYVTAAVLTSWVDTGRPVCYAPPENPFWDYRYWDVGRDNKNQYLHGTDEAFPWHGEALAAHLIRGLNVLIGAGVVWLTWAIGRAIWPRQPWLAVGAAAFVAFNPMFDFMSGAINNDVIAACSGAAVTLASVRLVRDKKGLRWRWGVVLGIVYGLALLSKFNLAAIALTVETAVTYSAWRHKQWKQWWQVNVLIGVVTLALSGWWFVRNQILYGEPTGVQRLTELWGVRDPSENWGTALYELPYVWTSLWGRFGYGQVPLPSAIYSGLWWFAVFAVSGLFVPLLFHGSSTQIRQNSLGETLDTLAPFALLTLNIILFFAVIFNYLLISPAGPMGRFFFPALPSLAILMFYGLSQWGRLKEKINLPHLQSFHLFSRMGTKRNLAVLTNIAMLTLSLVALFGYLQPAYARPPAYMDNTAVPHPTNAQFDTLINLRGYEVSTDTVQPGGFVDIKLYWEVTGTPPGNYLLFVHLSDEVGMVAQRDTHPGLGNFPSSLWQPGDRFVESIRLYVPETAYTPDTATLRIGFYAPNEGYRLGITGADGQGLGDALPLGIVNITPLPAARYANAQNQNFNNEIKLVGYEYSQRDIVSGTPLTVTLYWEALRDISTDYRFEVHLREEPGESWNTFARADVQPPTTQWRKGQLFTTEHILDTAVPANTYLIHVALIDIGTNIPQNIVADDGHWLDNHLLLARVRIRSVSVEQ